MTDFRRFLTSPGDLAAEVVAYTGGRFVRTRTRRLRVAQPPTSPGWYRARVRGRVAELVSVEDAPAGLDQLPALRGHRWGQRLVLADASAPELAFLPSDEPLALAPLIARRWHDESLVVESEDFETEHEELVRDALARGAGLGDLRQVPASLRAAFVYSLLEAEGVGWHPLEVRARLPQLAAEGRPGVRAELARLEAERARAREEARARAEASAREESGQPVWETWQEARDRSFARRPRPTRAESRGEAAARSALAAAGATFVSLRSLQSGSQFEVRYRFLDANFETVVAAETLNVLDAGICLDGADRALTLESLPGVIREAVQTGLLVVTRGRGGW
jgi:hypothetical protein